MKLTRDQFHELVNRWREQEIEVWGSKTKRRRGQALYMALSELHPELAREIAGTKADPSNDDRRIQNLWQAIS